VYVPYVLAVRSHARTARGATGVESRPAGRAVRLALLLSSLASAVTTSLQRAYECSCQFASPGAANAAASVECVGTVQLCHVCSLCSGDGVRVRRHHEAEKVEPVVAHDGLHNVGVVDHAGSLLLGDGVGGLRQLGDKEFARAGEEHGRLGGDHTDVFVAAHEALDAPNGQHTLQVVCGRANARRGW